MEDLLSKLHLVLPALLVLNIILSSASQVLAALGKKDIPVISQISALLKKVIDFLGSNVAH